MSPGVPKIDHDGVALQICERGRECSEALADLKSIRTAEAGNDAQSRSAGDCQCLAREHGCADRATAEAVRDASVIEFEIQQIRDRAALHVAVDKHD